jgi:hypothetical protein
VKNLFLSAILGSYIAAIDNFANQEGEEEARPILFAGL